MLGTVEELKRETLGYRRQTCVADLMNFTIQDATASILHVCESVCVCMCRVRASMHACINVCVYVGMW